MLQLPETAPQTLAFAPQVAVLSTLAAAVLALACWRLWSRLRRAERVAAGADGHERRLAELERQHLVTGKLIEGHFGFMRELYRVAGIREIPALLLKYMVWLFEPDEAVVLIRRRPAVADRDREHQLIVAASKGVLVRARTVVDLTNGPLSRVASTGVVLEETDLARDSEFQGFVPNLAVPLMVDEEILGVLALMAPRRKVPHARQLLQLFARSATLAFKNASTLNRVRSEADLDPLTGVLNRGALMALLREFAQESLATGRPLSVFLFDIDHFKSYNDANGHLPGDDCLRLLARLVADQTRADDAFGRYGGEEFLILLPGRTPEEGLLVAEKTRQLVAEYPFPYGEGQPLGRVSISGGVACLPDHATTPEEVLEAADRALYLAKSAGRNRVECGAAPGKDDLVGGAEPEPEVVRDEVDDLQRIRGIGAKYEQALADAGITRFRQIAEIDWRGIGRLAAQLGTNAERILREEWLQQARTLHAEKYGEELEPTT
jgi:diguanylate cyclase (GGDEF)-like protein